MTQKELIFTISDLSLVAALTSLGIPLQEEPPFVKITTEKGVQYKFFVKQVSDCGKFKTRDMIQAWNDEDFVQNNPEHPISYIKCAFSNRENLLDVVKQAKGFIIIEKNGRMAVISENASPEKQQELLSQL